MKFHSNNIKMLQSPVLCNFGTSTIIIHDKPYRCKHCEKRFEKISLLRLHLRTHYGTKLFFCNICRKEFGKIGDYKGHINSHTGERPFVCKICNRRYMKNRYAKDHVKFHLFRKPFKCSHCMKGYFRMHDLKRHVRLEHKYKTRKKYNLCDRHAQSYCKRFYLCRTCRKQFSSIENRNKHQCMKSDRKIRTENRSFYINKNLFLVTTT